MPLLANLFFIVPVSIFIFIAYIFLWKKYLKNASVPKGVGYFLILLIFFYQHSYGIDAKLLECSATIAFFGFVYWLDDIFGLNASIRIFISGLVGVIISIIYFGDQFSSHNYIYALLIFVFCVLNIALVNIINFYDGADLNLSLLMILTCSLIILSPDISSVQELRDIAILCIAFTTAFCFFNFRPRLIYFGDGGCFIFGSLLTLLIANMIHFSLHDLTIFIPLVLPIIDISYVLILRIINKQNLLSRNYLHLYQQMAIKKKGFWYLSPQVVNTFLCLIIWRLLFRLADTSLAINIFTVLLTSLIVYFFFRLYVLKEVLILAPSESVPTE